MKTKQIFFPLLAVTAAAVSIGTFSSCSDVSATVSQAAADKDNSRTVSKETKAFWHDGHAELSSYSLTQARYGETHEGTAVLVYVTEPFSKSANTKADYDNPENVPVLKLNKTLKFNTGIYPYSLMSSTFFPLENGNTSLKIASSLQEWCGMTYLEMKNEGKLVFDFDSYYEGFTFENKKVDKTILEDDLWTLIRLNPELLPVGEQVIIPAMSFLRLRNREPEAFKVSITTREDGNGATDYTLKYPELEREITIRYATAFPHAILGWEDTHYSGYGDEKKMQTSRAELRKSIKTDYWNQNHNKDAHWREKLAL